MEFEILTKRKKPNSWHVYEGEFRAVLRRKEYTQQRVSDFFLSQKTLLGQTDNEICHSCFKAKLPIRTLVNELFSSEHDSDAFCHFCLQRVCSSQCLHQNKFTIPRNLGFNGDLHPQHVCRSAGNFLMKFNYMRIDPHSPSVLAGDM